MDRDHVKKVFGKMWYQASPEEQIDIGLDLLTIRTGEDAFIEERALCGTNDFLVQCEGFNFVNVIAHSSPIDYYLSHIIETV